MLECKLRHFLMSTMTSIVRAWTLAHPCSRLMSRAKLQFIKEAKMLDKMIQKNSFKKKSEQTLPRKLKQEFLTSAYDNEGTNRRTAALNKFYMEQLIEMINAGPFSSELSELGIEFSKVRLASCRSSINIYWISNKEGVSEAAISEVLQKAKKELQTQLGFMRNMRKIPFATFVKDLRLEKARQVEKLFEVADYGKDHEASYPRKVVNPEMNLKGKKMNKEENEKMRDNILGLDHGKIAERIKQEVRRFQAVNISNKELEEVKEFETPGKLVVFSKEIFFRFYKRKMYLDKKLRSREYNETYFDLREEYDPEKEAEKHWESLNCKDSLVVEELQELQKLYENPDHAHRDQEGHLDFDEDDEEEESHRKEQFNRDIRK